MQSINKLFRFINRVSVTSDVLGVDGRLRVQKGAIGTVSAKSRGYLTVSFDDGPQYVELSGCGHRIQEVPTLSTRSEGLFYRHMGLFFRVMETFPDNEEGTRDANEYMETHPGASVLAVENGRAILANTEDMGVKSLEEIAAVSH